MTIMKQKKIYFDTNVFIEVADGRISPHSWTEVCKVIPENYHYCVSPLTVIELLNSVISGSEQHFHQNRKRLEALIQPGFFTVFDFVRGFMYWSMRNRYYSVRCEIEWGIYVNIASILWVKNKIDLHSEITLPFMNGHQKVKLLYSKALEEVGKSKQGYIDFMNNAKNKGQYSRDKDAWARGMIHHLKLDESRLLEVKERFDATYRFEVCAFKQLKDENYSVGKHDSDLIDGQQLCYLSDPDTYFVTQERRMKEWIKGSPQLNRIYSVDELLAKHKEAISR